MARRPLPALIVITGVLAALLAGGCRTCPCGQSTSVRTIDDRAVDVEINTSSYAVPQAAQTESVTETEKQVDETASEETTEDSGEKEAEEAEKKEKERVKKQKKRAKDARERGRRKDKLERDLRLAHWRMEKTEYGQETAMIGAREALAKAEFELEAARKRLKTLTENEIPARVARAELNLQGASDNLLEAQQELEQLTLMYAEEQIADKAREIVLDRAKRRLERSRRSFAIQRDELDTMKERHIPLEIAEREHNVQSKQEAHAKAERALRMAKYDREIAYHNSRAELERVKVELERLAEEEAEAAEEAQEEGDE